MVAIPITNDQPGVASRLEWLGVAEVVSPSRLTVSRLRARARRVLSEPHYRAGRSDGERRSLVPRVSHKQPTSSSGPLKPGCRCCAHETHCNSPSPDVD